MNPIIFFLSGLAIALACFCLAGLVHFRSPRVEVNRLLIIFNICVGTWGLGLAGVGLAPNEEISLWFWRFGHIGGYLLGISFFHLSTRLCGLKRHGLVILAYSFAGLGIATLGFAIEKPGLTIDGVSYFRANEAYTAAICVWLIFVLIGITQLFRTANTLLGVRRKQFLLIGYAMSIGFSGGVTFWFGAYGIPIPAYGSFAIPVYAAITTYGIARYGITDAKVAITETTLLAAIYLIVLGGPFLVGWLGENHLHGALGTRWWLVPLGLSTVLATIGPVAYIFLRRRAEERLLSDQRRYRRLLLQAAKGMTQVREATKLARLIVRVVARSLGTSRAALFIWDEETKRFHCRASHRNESQDLKLHEVQLCDPLVRHLVSDNRILNSQDLSITDPIYTELSRVQVSLVVPGIIKDKLIGFLVLGEKLSVAPYTADDIHALSTLGHEAAIAIENALSYQDLQKMNEQLSAAMARLASQERLAAAGQFAAGMAHEIRNPLAAIKTFTEYLPQKYSDADFREKFFRVMRDEVDRINTILKGLLDFARPAPLNLKIVKPSEVIQDVVTLLSSECLRRNITIETSFQENGTLVEVDPQQLKQVILNLMLNAIEAMSSGGRLKLQAEHSGEYFKLSVADNGIGISPEQMRSVWDPFFSTKERGMGLGLAIVKSIIERHGGSIHLNSTPGSGTTFEVVLSAIHQLSLERAVS